MILDTESWMNIRRFRALHAAGATFAEIGRECGCDWRTVRKYLAEDAASVPPAGPPRLGTQPLLITPFIPLVEAWLRADLALKGTVVHERLVAEYGFTGHYPAGQDVPGRGPAADRRRLAGRSPTTTR
jgi:predicted transcriptional regulator